MKILSSADWHINLHRKKIPNNWQTNRFNLLFKKLLEIESSCDVHVIAGDLFDKIPEPDEVCLLLSYLNSVQIPTLIVPGNHEATSKGKTFWEHFLIENTITNPLVHIFIENQRIEINNQGFCTFPYGCVQTNKMPSYVDGDILITHIRGEVPPHITAEFDFEKLRPWKLILLGDLHFRHKYKDYPAYYPGSPLNTTFDRKDDKAYGVDIITFNNINDYTVEFIDLQLPKLIRKTIAAGEPMLSDAKHHVVYEITGSIDELAQIKKSELLDKKVVAKPIGESTLDLKDKSIIEELELWLDYIHVADKDAILTAYKDLGIQ